MSVVIKMPKREKKYARETTPLELLEALLEEARAGKIDPAGLIVVQVDAIGAGFQVSSRTAGIETIAETYFYLDLARMQVLVESEV